MMPAEQDGLHVDPQILIRTQANFIAESRMREVQLEAAVQQLLGENAQLKDEITRLDLELNPIIEVEAEQE